MRTWVVLAALIVICGCGDDEDTNTASGPAGVVVHPGQSIQAAINAAAPNTTITVEPGIYSEASTGKSALTVTKDGIKLIGNSTPGNPVVVRNSGGQKNGIWVSPADSVDVQDDEHPPCGVNGNLVHDFTLQGFTIVGFDQFGVYLGCNDGYTLNQNVADGNQVYGLFPVRSHHGSLTNNEARNTPKDAAIYIGQSDNITATGNVSHDSLIGIEVENCGDVTVSRNEAYGNTVGIILDILPNLQRKGQSNVVVSDNNVHDNNRPNSGQAGDLISAIPLGSGILVLSGSNITVSNNTLMNNNFTGVAVASYCTGTTLIGQTCDNIDFEPNPQAVQVINNHLTNNGANPDPDSPVAGLAADLVWDNTGTGNCWGGNTPTATMKTLSGHPLPACP